MGDAAIVTVPDADHARFLRRALASVPVESVVRVDALQAILPVAEVLGPAVLGYVSRQDFRPMPGSAAVTLLSPAHEDLRALADSVGRADADESGIDEIDSPVFAVCDGPEVVAAAGYQTWSADTAHMCVLTAARCRGRGLARQVASAAVAHALDADLLPQWRARPESSRRVAAALGFRELGGQLSFRLRPTE
ncbi:GNAT family N-acetyltransferase [Yinghuangia soli]|uniref:GNAT family N-acetyltransferase n=1 Tax=Yinghuangia soli TaxID=2908204 RepID=UPI0027E230C3|nr:GNAT family N-acetyltransferase [Yinghuangia soli]